MKHPVLFDSFIRMNIDVDPKTKKRPNAFYQIQKVLNTKITKVPTLITPNAQYILSDVEAFKWLEYQIRLLSDNSNEELKPFNPNEMGSFSDSYADFGSTDLNDTAKEQSFKFYHDGTIPDDNYLQTNKSWDPKSTKTNGFLDDLESKVQDADFTTKQTERQYFDEARNKQRPGMVNMKEHYVQQNSTDESDFNSKFNSYSQQRRMPQQNQQRASINFTDPNFGLAGRLGSGNKSGMSQKDKELNSKLEQLMNDRENTDKQLNHRPRHY